VKGVVKVVSGKYFYSLGWGYGGTSYDEELLNDHTTSAKRIEEARLDFLEILKHRVDHFKGLIDLFSDFRTSQDDLSTYEDQKHNLWLDHSVDETREQLRFVRTEVVMA